MRKCPECSNLVEENLKECKYCGYPFDGTEEIVELNDDNYSEKDAEILSDEVFKEEKEDLKLEDSNNEKEKWEQIKEEDKKNSEVKKTFYKKKLVLFGTVIGMCIFGIIIYKKSDLGRYNSAQSEYKNKQYAEAMEKFKELEKYKDSEKMYNKAKHMDAVSKDKIQPSFKNVPEKIEIVLGETFDGRKWCEENNISVVDDVTTNVKYSIDDSKIDMMQEGIYNFILLAEDEEGNEKQETVEVVVKREYTQEEISDAVKSTYETQLSGLQNIEYDKESESVWVYILSDGMAEAVVAARENSIVKASWDELTKELDRISKEIYSHLLSEGYDDIDSVCLTLLNDLNPNKVLYVSVNGIEFHDTVE